MITLFVKTGCPFCARTIAAFDAHQVPYEEKNIADDAIAEELIRLGGKRQTPFMVDGDTMMYESQSIIEYIEKKHPQAEGTPKKPRIHFARGTEVCPSE
jgi:glutaredoxin